jgi:transcriptional antiterminator RfaH
MKNWHAIYTKPHKERQVDAWLQEKGIETYLPTVRRRRRRNDRPERVIYFNCYLFARLDLTAIPLSSVAWMPGIRCLVSAGERPIAVPDDVIVYIRNRLEQIDEIGYGDLRPGDRVRITTGPFRDLEAVFDRPLSAADRVSILLRVLGQLTPIEIDRSALVQL